MDQGPQIARFREPRTGAAAAVKMNTDDEEVVRSRDVDLRPGEAAIWNLNVVPRPAVADRPAADDAVGDRVACARFAEVNEVRSERGIDHLANRCRGAGTCAIGARIIKLLNGDDVRLERLEDAKARRFVALVVSGRDVGGHHPNRAVRLDGERSLRVASSGRDE